MIQTRCIFITFYNKSMMLFSVVTEINLLTLELTIQYLMMVISPVVLLAVGHTFFYSFAFLVTIDLAV